MAKRKQPDPDPEGSPEVSETPSKRRRTRTTQAVAAAHTNEGHDEDYDGDITMSVTPQKQKTPTKAKRKSAAETLLDEEADAEQGSPTPKANGRTLFSTPKRRATAGTPSKTKADRSAKRKSARALAEAEAQAEAEDEDEDDWDGQVALAKEILGADVDEDQDGVNDDRDNAEQTVEPEDATNTTTTTPVKTPGKRGRPKGAKNKRSPTPEGDIAPEERYFFQNRAGPPQISSNKFTSIKLLSHDEYFEQIQKYKDRHERDRAQLMKLHARSFPQWSFELDQGFGLCLYGYGSKRELTTKFAEWLYKHKRRPARNDADEKTTPSRPPRIVVINGYTPKLNVRGILNTIAAAVTDTSDAGDDDDDDDMNDASDSDEQGHQQTQSQGQNKTQRKRLRLVGQPHEMVDTLLAYLDHLHSSSSTGVGNDGVETETETEGEAEAEGKGKGEHDNTHTHMTPPEITIIVNSIDAAPLRRTSTQTLLARLADHPSINMIATTDTPTFATLWNSSLLDSFRFIYHDCTTFSPYTAEISVVDEVHELLGRKRTRVGGKEGIGFVLKSLPENARNLYRLLICEILELLADGAGDGAGAAVNGIMTDGHGHGHAGYNHDDDDDGDSSGLLPVPARSKAKPKPKSKSQTSTSKHAAAAKSEVSADQVGVEYRTLYQKASEEFICSSSMNFQFLLKEFHDHQMITSRRDAGGTEVLSVPLDSAEMEAVLEDLVI